MTQVKRPTTCSGMAAIDPTLGEAGCKRLPRHGGDHRAYKTAKLARQAAAAPKASPKGKKLMKGRKLTLAGRRDFIRALKVAAKLPARGRLTRADRRSLMAQLAACVDCNDISASDALGVAALIA